MTTHLLKPECSAYAIVVRCGVALDELGPSDDLSAEDSLDSVDCAGCLRDLVIDMRLEAIGSRDLESEWIAGSDTGISSKVIWSVMTGREVPCPHGPDVPHDPADFGRCHRLLARFPAWRSRMHEVAAVYPEWRGLVDRWDELTALYLEELPSGSAPKTWRRMRELRGESDPS
ncbi:MAG: hypothetical protein KDC38_17965 [Planctomycetes bacterium]|nr:hypothetical protein [Planctomycetota bacterium]